MSVEKTMTVELGERSYPIHIGTGILAEPGLLAQYLQGSQVAVVTNEIVAELALPALLNSLKGLNAEVDVLTLADGEGEKNLTNYARIMDFLVAKRHNRSTQLIALGGGVVGDITGFAAATYQRGVRFIQIPTTLLAQVDSSVGGKTAVNHPSGKNLIGAFHQPVAVIADLEVLRSLPAREFRAGMAEVIKYGVIADGEFFEWLESHASGLLNFDIGLLTHAVSRSCEIKAAIVAEDEREAGRRALLNYGHTFGHAIEALTGYQQLLHGEAVAIGMTMAADLACRMGILAAEQGSRIKTLIAACGLPVEPPSLPVNEFLAAMGMDKKVVDGTLRLVLARRLGEAFVTDEIDAEMLKMTLKAGSGLCRG
jgi:3-dehydroquinate synthase